MQQDTTINYKALYEEAQSQLMETLGAVAMLQHRIAQLEKMIFGTKHERFVPSVTPPGQLAWIFRQKRWVK